MHQRFRPEEPGGRGVTKLLGALEAEIMDFLWRRPAPATVREVLSMINAGRDRPAAYTTIMTVMGRLADKGLLRRRLVGQSHEYVSVISRDEFLRRASEEMASKLVEDFGDVAVASFVSALERINPRWVEALRTYLEADERNA